MSTFQLSAEMVGNNSELDRVNDELASTLLPVIIIVSLYIIIGIIGNPLVACYFLCLVKPSPSSHFIAAMAVFDIIICSVSMPLEIVDMEFPYKFPSKTGCKIFRFVSYFATISAGLNVVAIAADRYRKVCQPLKTQITTKMTKIIIGIVCLSSFCISWPALLFYDVIEVNITSTSEIIGYDCTTVRTNEFTVYINVFNGICFLIFLGCITTLAILYGMIGRKLFLLKRFRVSTLRKTFKNEMSTPPTSFHSGAATTEQQSTALTFQPINVEEKHEHDKHQYLPGYRAHSSEQNPDISYEIESENDKDTNINRKSPDLSNISSTANVTSSSKIQSSVTKSKKTKQKVKDQYITLKKYTMLMLAITVVFVLSFLPYLGLITWRTLAEENAESKLSKSSLVAYEIFYRSWMISSVLNPFIYGFFNSDFRGFVSAVFHGTFCWDKIKKNKSYSHEDSTHESYHTK